MKYSVENSAATAVESYNDFGGVSAEGFPRLPGAKIGFGIISKVKAQYTGSGAKRSVIAKSLDAYLNSEPVKASLKKIKEYCDKKHWGIVGIDGLQKSPTLWTSMFKALYGGSLSPIINNVRKNIFEKTVDGIKIVIIYTDNSDNSAAAKLNDKRSARDWAVCHLVLAKNDGAASKYFTKQISNKLLLNESDKEGQNNRTSNYATNVNLNKGNESLLPIATSADGLRFFDM